MEKQPALWSRAPCRAEGSKQRAGSRMTLCFHGHCASSEEILSESTRLLKMDPLEGPKDRTGGRVVYMDLLRGQAPFFALILPMPDKFLQRENAILSPLPSLLLIIPRGRTLLCKAMQRSMGGGGQEWGPCVCTVCLRDTVSPGISLCLEIHDTGPNLLHTLWKFRGLSQDLSEFPEE